ncbi:cytochrome c4 [Rhizobium tropici]|uniref:Cytochrome c4 n=1 Tax=Rhizobium tropici TaxID=398 RepID=A0A5B0VQE4_RHITR|nr:c-type cytochrome [Rhizobium tropici]KAA1176518.1 cytochrome c4 [Rhizobium tropici]
MTKERLFVASNRWFVVAVGTTSAIFAVAAAVGFVFLPYAQPDRQLSGIWDAICSAAGIARQSSQADPISPNYPISTVVMDVGALKDAPLDSVGRGATLAQQCAICHGPTGISRADSPNLAGQYPSVIYKQLKDFKSGARVNAVMTPFAQRLSEQDMLDLAAYYAYLPRLPAYHPRQPTEAPDIVVYGAPLRGIAPCGACHGGLENKAGSPWLEGQSAAYIKSQLVAFAGDGRRNDINQQMRNIARQMSAEEIDEAAAYFATQPSEGK